MPVLAITKNHLRPGSAAGRLWTLSGGMRIIHLRVIGKPRRMAGSLAPTRRRVDKLRFPKSPRRRHIKRAVFESTASPPQGSRVQFQPFNRSRHPSTRRKEGNMRVQDIVRNACPICGKEITLAAIEPHPTHSERELHTYRCVDCGPVKTTSVRPRSGGLTRAA